MIRPFDAPVFCFYDKADMVKGKLLETNIINYTSESSIVKEVR